MIELIGGIATVLSVTGVILNNRRRIECFYIWLVSNLLSAGIHAVNGPWSLFIRDMIFIALAIEGIIIWKRTDAEEAAHETAAMEKENA
jgi:nicotinamide riboside transporter PnuC